MPCIVMSAQFSCTACTQVKSLGYGQVTSAARACSTWDLLPRRSVLNTAKCAQPCSADARLYYQAHPTCIEGTTCCLQVAAGALFTPQTCALHIFSLKSKTTLEAAIPEVRSTPRPKNMSTRQNLLRELTFNTVQPSPCSISYLSQTNMYDLCFEQPDISNSFE